MDIFRFLLLIFVVWRSSGAQADRVVSMPVVNPGCNATANISCVEPWLTHTTAQGTNTTVHHLWGARGPLTFVVVTTHLSTNLTVSWQDLEASEPNSVDFTDEPLHLFGVTIPYLILFNDTDDSGQLDNPNKTSVKVPMTDFKWAVKEVMQESQQEAAIILETVKYQDKLLPSDTRIVVQVAGYGVHGRSTVFPRLLRSPDSAQFDLVLDHLIFNLTSSAARSGQREDVSINDFVNGRWALELVIFSSEDRHDDQQDLQFSTQMSLDDEYTPGVFSLDQVTTPLAREQGVGGYLQWRPISYLTSDRDFNSATTPTLDPSLPPLANISAPLVASLAYAMLGEELLEVVAAQTVVSFGQPLDGFYTETSYTTWTVAYGEGQPPQETFSVLVIVVISLGLGIPTVIFLVGAVVVLCRKYRRHHSDDPLLVD